MGTNFYVDDDPTCDNPAHTKRLHIGKSSGGWKFGFHAIPEHNPPLTSWAAWREFLTGRTITDEYGRVLTLEEFTERVEQRPTPTGLPGPICRVDPTPEMMRVGFGSDFVLPRPNDRDYHDPEGFDFYDGEFS